MPKISLAVRMSFTFAVTAVLIATLIGCNALPIESFPKISDLILNERAFSQLQGNVAVSDQLNDQTFMLTPAIKASAKRLTGFT
ncbi:unnamed protein product [Hermetia illucens]|uniref:Uncharacterized protein n=1 Tax=Hermetia illucens TaxID=343691 RepID=A0A7R8UP61_HERIL|nr:unnamed protein product [Hermetia illucens]